MMLRSNFRSLPSFALATAILTACGGGGSSPTSGPTAEPTNSRGVGQVLNGAGVKGLLANAAVTLYKADSNQASLYDTSKPIASAVTDSKGQFNDLRVPAGVTAPFVLVIDGTNAIDLDTGLPPVMTQLVNFISREAAATDSRFYATPLTTVAVQLASMSMSKGDSSEQITTKVNTSAGNVRKVFGLGVIDNVDILRDPPVINSTVTGQVAQQKVIAYRIATEALVAVANQMSKNTQREIGGTVTTSVDQVIQNLAVDYQSDGTVNGKANDVVLAGIDTNVLSQDLGTLTIPNTDIQVKNVLQVITKEALITNEQPVTVTQIDAPTTITNTIVATDPVIAETQPTAPAISKAAWSLAYVDSQELRATDGAAVNAFDGNLATAWQTSPSNVIPMPAHELQIDLGANYTIEALRYAPSQNTAAGRIGNYELYVSDDGLTWGSAVTNGRFADTTAAKTVKITAKSGRFIRIRALDEVEGRASIAVAEFDVFAQENARVTTQNVTTSTTIGGTTTTTQAATTTTTVAPTTTTIQLATTTAAGATTTTVRSVTTTTAQQSTTTTTARPATTTTVAPVTTTTATPVTTTRSTTSSTSAPTTSTTASTTTTTVPAAIIDIPKTNWSLTFVDSQELNRENAAAIRAFDGDPNTFWHTQWYASSPLPPHEIQIDLGTVYDITGFRYLPRQDGGTHGYINAYEFYVSTDGQTWSTPTASGNFSNDALAKQINSTSKVGRFVRLRALSEIEGQAWTSAAEINVLGRITSASNTTLVTSTTTTTTTTQPTTTTTTTTRSTSTTTSTTVSSTTTTTQQSAGDDPVNWSQVLANAKGVVRYVSSATEFSSASSAARPGDVIVVRNGTYSGWPTQFIASNGTSTAPIVYMAETSGQVIFQDQEWLFQISGDWNIIGGFVFKRISNGPIGLTGPTGSNTTGALDNRITDVTLIECGQANPFWMIEIKNRSHRNRIDHSLFDRNYGHIRVAVDSSDTVTYGASQDLRVDHNVFQNTLSGNAWNYRVPVIQFGQGEPSQAGSSLLPVRAVFEYNTIQNHVTYYNEIVSSKTSNNVIRYNTIKDSYGGLMLRDGNYSEIYGNYISGTGGGPAIEIHGAYHKIYNNIINTPEKKHGIYLGRWGARLNDAAIPNTHDVLIANNTVLSYLEYGLRLGDCDNGACNTLSNITVANNIFKGTQGQLFYYAANSTTNLAVRNNLYFNAGSASYSSGFNQDAAPLTGDPLIATALSLPAGSLAVNTGWPVSGINLDFYKNARIIGSLPDIGAIEYKP